MQVVTDDLFVGMDKGHAHVTEPKASVILETVKVKVQLSNLPTPVRIVREALTWL